MLFARFTRPNSGHGLGPERLDTNQLVRHRKEWWRMLLLIGCVSGATFGPNQIFSASAQQGGQGTNARVDSSPREELPSPNVAKQGQAVPVIADVRVLGNETVPTSRVLARLKTRPGRYYDPDLVHADTQEIIAMKSFRDVRTYTQQTPAGLIITFEVLERPVVKKLKFFGNRAIGDKQLSKQIGFEEGDPLDVFSVRLARQNIEDFYQRKGFPHTEVEILEGTDPSHRNVIFLVHEDQKRRVWKTEFRGNTIASDARLRTFVKTKPGVLKMFGGGKVDEEAIENDVERIIAYYRSLGFFNARVSRELLYDDNGGWLTLRFVIDEGPQYDVQSISIAGNERFGSQELVELLELKAGEKFNADKMQRDVNLLKDLYGSQGHIFAEVKADPLFLEAPGKMDLVYEITEGDVYRVRNINVHITGDYGVTKRSVVLNRISLAPGDIIDIREIRNSERRLRGSGLFTADPATGTPPRLEVKPIDPIEAERVARQLMAARGADEFRGQSPDRPVRWVDLEFQSP